MLAAQAVDKEGTLEIVEVADPTPAPGEAVVRVDVAGLAPGAFNLLRMGRVPILPVVLGHEIAGTVTAVGDDADIAWVGRRVRVSPLLSCGNCEYCTTDREMMCDAHSMIGHAIFGDRAMELYERYRNGGLAELVLAPLENLDELPDNVDMELGAKTHDFANAIRALKLAELPRSGSTLIVTAASGAMGVATVALAPTWGVETIIAVGRDADRLESVRRLDPERVRVVVLQEDDTPQTLAGRIRAFVPAGAHAAVDFLPHGAGTSLIFGGLRTGARLVHMGVNPDAFQIPPAAFSVRCISFIGTRNGTRQDAREALQLLAQDPEKYRRLITHRFALDEAHRARDIFNTRSEPMWMSVVNPRLSSSTDAGSTGGTA